MKTPASKAITQRIVELRERGLDWRAIGSHVGLSHNACYLRWKAAQGIDERAQRKHAEALVTRLETRLQAAELVIGYARRWACHDGALAYALQAYEEAKDGR